MKHKRAIAKAISWETMSNLVCFGLAYLMFGNLGGCFLFTIICFVVKLVLYIPHDEIWDQISFGKNDADKFKNPKRINH